MRHTSTIEKVLMDRNGVSLRKKARLVKKQCLKCDKNFQSRGAHHRICPTCKPTVEIAAAGMFQTYKVMDLV